MINSETRWRFLYALAWAFEALQLQEKDAGWTEEELAWPKRIRRGEVAKLHRAASLLKDRFALVFQDMFRDLPRREYLLACSEMQGAVFLD